MPLHKRSSAKMSERITVLETMFPVIHEALAELNKKMDGMDHLVRGNGAPGIAQKVDAIKARVDTLEGGRNRWRDAFFTVGGGLVVGVAVFLFSTSWSERHAIQQTVPALQSIQSR